MKKNKPYKGCAFPFGRFQRGGLIITLSEWEIIKELTFIQKILFSLGLRHMRNIEDMEHRISKLVARIAHNEIFGYEPDFGKFLFTINMAIGKKNWEVESRRRQLQLLQKQIKEVRDKDTLKHGWLEQVNQAISCIKKKDFVSLRSIYRQLFHKIIVHPLDNTKLQLEFIFNNVSTTTYKVVDTFCAAVGLVGATGIEPATSGYAAFASQALCRFLAPARFMRSSTASPSGKYRCG